MSILKSKIIHLDMPQDDSPIRQDHSDRCHSVLDGSVSMDSKSNESASPAHQLDPSPTPSVQRAAIEKQRQLLDSEQITDFYRA